MEGKQPKSLLPGGTLNLTMETLGVVGQGAHGNYLNVQLFFLTDITKSSVVKNLELFLWTLVIFWAAHLLEGKGCGNGQRKVLSYILSGVSQQAHNRNSWRNVGRTKRCDLGRAWSQ